MEEALSNGNRKIVTCYSRLKTTVIAKGEVEKIDPVFLSFRNINTPEDYFLFRDEDEYAEGENEFSVSKTVNSGCLDSRTPGGD